MNKELKDKELENVTGGIDNIDVHEQAALKNSNITTAPNLPATELGEITIGDICGAITSKTDTGNEKETTSQKVGIIPGIPVFP